ncbi:hypothetical protein [Amycolatopsis sp. NPDC051061]|uniref:hypothetical protein n=1 Tax=Amycolatopsis sp. NPDC051061 TaxID=3155042 RepID=UPI00343C9537
MSEHELPLRDFDQTPIGVLQHRIRSLDESQVRALVEHEHAHGGRVAILQLLETRLDRLRHGAEPAPGDPQAAPPVSGTPGGSPVGESTAAPGSTPLRHGVAEQTPARGRP